MMNRLTRREENTAPRSIEISDDVISGWPIPLQLDFSRLVGRLARYEDTGLEPEEVRNIKERWELYGGDEGIMDAFRCAVELANIRGSGEKGVNG